MMGPPPKGPLTPHQRAIPRSDQLVYSLPCSPFIGSGRSVTTRLRPFTGPGFAYLVSTLAICGVAALVVPPVCVASDTSDVSTIGSAPDRTQPEHGWAAELIVTDPADTDDGDDDGGDDAPAASAVVPSAHGASHTFDRSWLLSHPVVVSRAEQVLEGHALRGPPSITENAPDLDDADDDDDRDFDCQVSPSTSCPEPGGLRPRPVFHFQFAHTLNRASDGPSMRAP